MFIAGSFIRRLKKWYFETFWQEKERIYLISDLHLDHSAIIGYCRRPFSDVERMNETLIRNWNGIVRREDTVFHLGDFAFGRNPRNFKGRLQGRKRFIRGNHDRKLRGARTSVIIDHQGFRFFLCHSPEDRPKEWGGWVVHGHTHNHRSRYPFINGDLRTINVSCELTGYAPVSLDFIISLDPESIKRMETVYSEPERKPSQSLIQYPADRPDLGDHLGI
ncbi:MAG: metallophosphoesterase family protein [Methanomicrobiaceae archaeon]|nr:metallophosphoesterase family protein [Methanomicrobiaceae archaeon]